MTLLFNILKDHESIQRAFTKLEIEQGFLIMLNENTHHSKQNTPSLLLTSFKKNIPLIGNKYSDSEIAALASVYTPLAPLVKETVQGVIKMCIAKEFPSPVYSRFFKVRINQSISSYLGLDNLNEETLAKAVSKLEKQTRKKVRYE